MVEKWCGCDYLVGMAVHQKAEIAEMTVRVADDGIEDNHLIQGRRIFVPQCFAVLSNGGQPALRHQSPYGDEREFLGCEKIAE